MKSPQKTQAFSLVELLVVIAVIGIIAAIAIPNVMNVQKNAKFAKDQRNAQAIASAIAEASAAGYTNTDLFDIDSATIIAAQGGFGVVGKNGTNIFRVSGLTPYDAYAASWFISQGAPTDRTRVPFYRPDLANVDYESQWDSRQGYWMSQWIGSGTYPHLAQ